MLRIKQMLEPKHMMLGLSPPDKMDRQVLVQGFYDYALTGSQL